MQYDEVIERIENKRRFGTMCGRDVTARILDVMGHPEAGMRTVHIAGTNGKGSTAASIAAMLTAAGFKTGLFTSPHLVDFTERIRIDGEEMPHGDAARIGEVVLRGTGDGTWGMGPEGPVTGTMFDDSLLMALLWFREMHCDYVVLETGLGGRLDSTRGLAVTPEVSVITRIGLDHTAILGDSIEAIAGEKAGILRPGTELVIAENCPEADQVIRTRAEALGIRTVDLNSGEKGGGIGKEATEMAERFPSHLAGAYQRENRTSAAAAVLLLAERDRELWEKKQLDKTTDDAFREFVTESIRKGFAAVRWPGRMQILSEDPFLICDGAHNPQGIRAFRDSLVGLHGKGPYIFITGVLRDKDFRPMAALMSPLAASVYTAAPDSPRALSAEELAEIYRQSPGHPAAVACSSTGEALRQAMEEAARTGLPVASFGSLYFTGALLEAWRDESCDQIAR